MKSRTLVIGSSAAALLGLGGCAGLGTTQMSGADNVAPLTRVTGTQVTAAMHYQYGKDALARGQVRAAMAHFRGALNADGNHVDAVNGLAIAYSLEGRNEVAIGLLRSALVRDPDSTMLMGNLARAQMRAGRIDDARATLDIALSREPVGTEQRASLEAMDREFTRGVLARGPVTKPVAPAQVLAAPVANAPGAIALQAPAPRAAPAEQAAQASPAAQAAPAAPAAEAASVTQPGPAAVVVAAQPAPAPKAVPDYLIVTAEQSNDVVVRTGPGLYELRDRQVAQASLPRLTVEVLRSPEVSGVVAAAAAAKPQPIAERSPKPAPQRTAQAKASERAVPPQAAAKAGPKVRGQKVDVEYASIEVSNGAGINGLAARWSSQLRARGADVVRVTNFDNFNQTDTVVYYRRGFSADARDLAAKLAALNPKLVQTNSLRAGVDVRLVLGRDASTPKLVSIEAGTKKA